MRLLEAENAGIVSPSAKRRQSRPPGESEEVTPTKRRHPMTAEEARNKRLINLYNAVYNHVDVGHTGLNIHELLIMSLLG